MIKTYSHNVKSLLRIFEAISQKTRDRHNAFFTRVSELFSDSALAKHIQASHRGYIVYDKCSLCGGKAEDDGIVVVVNNILDHFEPLSPKDERFLLHSSRNRAAPQALDRCTRGL